MAGPSPILWLTGVSWTLGLGAAGAVRMGWACPRSVLSLIRASICWFSANGSIGLGASTGRFTKLVNVLTIPMMFSTRARSSSVSGASLMTPNFWLMSLMAVLANGMLRSIRSCTRAKMRPSRTRRSTSEMPPAVASASLSSSSCLRAKSFASFISAS